MAKMIKNGSKAIWLLNFKNKTHLYFSHKFYHKILIFDDSFCIKYIIRKQILKYFLLKNIKYLIYN